MWRIRFVSRPTCGKVRGYAEGELGRAKEYALATAEVRVPVRNFLGKLSTQVGVDTGASCKQARAFKLQACRTALLSTLRCVPGLFFFFPFFLLFL